MSRSTSANTGKLTLFAALVMAASPLPARADSSGNALAQYQLTDEQIAQKCANSIATQAGAASGKTQCETIYESLRDKANQYSDAETAAASTVAQAATCGADPGQASCLSAGAQAGLKAAAAHQQMAEFATQLQADSAKLAGGSQ